MKARLYILVCAGLFLGCICFAQVSSAPPKKWQSATIVYPSLGFSRLELSHNSPEAIRKEVLDTNTVLLIAKSFSLGVEDLKTIQIAEEPGYGWVQVYQLGKSENAFQVLSDQLINYVKARQRGHTREFLLAAITNRVASSSILDPDLRAIATNQAMVPIYWLEKIASGATTNKTGQEVSRTTTTTVVNGKSVTTETAHIPKVDEICRWASYVLVDGEVAWEYYLMFKADGSLNYIRTSRCDAKDYDPKLQKIIKEVEKDVEAEMKHDGTFGRFGSVHGFWHLKKKKLAARANRHSGLYIRAGGVRERNGQAI